MKSKLSKLKMPAKRDEMDLSELDQGGNDMESGQSDHPMEGDTSEEEASESPEKEHAEDAAATDLSSVSDEDLKAEMEKRGMMSDLEKKPADDQEQYS